MTAASWRAYTILALLTIVVGAAPFIVYQYEIAHGTLTSAADWYGQGNNHGPWRESWESLLVFFPQILLVGVVAMSAIFVEARDTRMQGFLIAVLMAAQLVAFVLHFLFLGWTFD